MSINHILPFITFIIPAIGMPAGLVSAATVTTFFLVLLIYFGKRITFALQGYILESLFIGWCAVSSLWSINIFASLGLCLSVFSVILISFVLRDNINLLEKNIELKKKVKIFLASGLVAAVILFFIEENSRGVLTRSFRYLFQVNQEDYFGLYMLDRGCALLSVISWVIIGILVNNKKYLYSLTLYIIIGYLLSISDSLASFLGFISGGLVFIWGQVFRTGFYKLLRVVILIGAVLLPFITYNINPRELSDKYANIIPESAKHRLFIWHFVTNKILEKPIIGFGMGSAKLIQVPENEMIDYHQDHWSPLPLHPHSNILQILLDLGLIGFLLWLLIINKWLVQITKNTFNNKYFSSIALACFVNYFIIGMISYSVWQLWWVYIGGWTAFMMVYLLKKYGAAREN